MQRYNKSSCVRRTKIKNLKAIHNTEGKVTTYISLCSKNKDKKSESNSQLFVSTKKEKKVVFEEQR